MSQWRPPSVGEAAVAAPDMQTPSDRIRSRQAGFSRVGAAVVLVLVGMVATFGVPRYRTMMERGKVGEAFAYLEHVQRAQAAHRASNGRFAWNLDDLEGGVAAPVHFWVSGPYSSDWTANWTMTLTRNGPARGNRRYTVVWTQEGFDAERSSVPEGLIPNR